MKDGELRGGVSIRVEYNQIWMYDGVTHLLIMGGSGELGIKTRKRFADTFEGVVETSAQSKRTDRAAYCHS